jgi:hypothetical protein
MPHLHTPKTPFGVRSFKNRANAIALLSWLCHSSAQKPVHMFLRIYGRKGQVKIGAS